MTGPREEQTLHGDPVLVGAARLLLPIGTRFGAVVVDGPRGRLLRCLAGARADTRWEVGSVSKALTGLLVADAADRGEVDLGTPLAALDPSYDGSPVGNVTVGELVTHRSGLPRVLLPASGLLGHALRRDGPYRSTTPTYVARRARRCRLRRRGTEAYSNVGAAVLGNALARVLGTDFPRLLHDRLAGPLGLSGTTADRSGPLEPPPGRAGDGRRARPWRMPGYLPAGGVLSTVDDLGTLSTALLAGTAPGTWALDPVGSETGAEGGTEDPTGAGRGMFWVVQRDPGSGRRMVWHNGETGGYASFLALFPDADRAVAVVLDRADATLAQRAALTLVRAVVGDDGVTDR